MCLLFIHLRAPKSSNARNSWDYPSLITQSVVNTDTKLLIYGLFQKGRVLAQDAIAFSGTQIALIDVGVSERSV